MHEQLRAAVRAARFRPEVLQAVDALYERVRAETDLRRPACVMSGRCCRFEEYGHRLYVTTIELAAFLHRLGDDRRFSIAEGGVCPFQSNKLCSVHDIRPFGCRMFFCDSTATRWQNEQYERFHAQLKRLHDELGVAYFYVEWRQALSSLGQGCGQ